MAAATPRSVTPIVAMFRNLLSGRQCINHQRYEQAYSPSNVPKATLPFGVSHKLADNYYYTRDGRHESLKATIPYGMDKKAIESGEEGEGSEKTVVPVEKVPRPGLSSYNWDM